MMIVRKSLKDLSISKEILGQLSSIRDKDIDYSDIPKLDENFWKKAELVMTSGKKQLP
ncbi:MAG: hypothetical protein JKY23_03925 [Nitrospinaceae bacterium]|nr:hypothetical protein [Nitrospinaceae bacterium]